MLHPAVLGRKLPAMDEVTAAYIDRGFSALRELKALAGHLEANHRNLSAWCWTHLATADVIPSKLPSELHQILDFESAHLREFDRGIAEVIEIAELLALKIMR